MSNERVLTFSEFAGKYSKDASDDSAANYSEIQGASDNFQDGFDEGSYEEGNLGPNRPLKQGEKMTPPKPGEKGSPVFQKKTPEGMEGPDIDTSGMSDKGYEGTPPDLEEEGARPQEMEGEEEEAPERVELDADDEKEVKEDDLEIESEGGNPEEEEKEEEEEAEEEEEEAEEEEEEAEEEEEEAEKEEEEEKNESRKFKRKSEKILESFDEFTKVNTNRGYADVLDKIELEDFEDEEARNKHKMHHEEGEDMDASGRCFVVCRSCGKSMEIPTRHNPFSKDSLEDENQWWRGKQFGMQCGCNM